MPTTTTTPEPINLCLLGSEDVGKSSITIQFVHNTFMESYDPTIEDTFQTLFISNEREFYLDIIDSAGPDEFHSMRDAYMRFSDGIILVYAINDRKSFSKIPDFVNRILFVKDKDTFPILMVANKNDLEDERTIDREEAIDLARELVVPRNQWITCFTKLFNLLGDGLNNRMTI